MLLKVADGNGGWVYFDGVEMVYLTARIHEVKQASELSNIGGPGASILVSKDCFKDGRSVAVGLLEYEKREERRRVLFTTVAYVCDDRGNTIDKLSVRSGKEGK